MKKIIIFLLVIGFSFMYFYCEASTNRPSAPAIEWWLRGQDKFEGAKISTKGNNDGTYEITRWEANGVLQPSDNELEKIIDDYEKYLKDKEKLEKDSQARVKTKLKEIGILEEDLDKIIKE